MKFESAKVHILVDLIELIIVFNIEKLCPKFNIEYLVINKLFSTSSKALLKAKNYFDYTLIIFPVAVGIFLAK